MEGGWVGACLQMLVQYYYDNSVSVFIDSAIWRRASVMLEKHTSIYIYIYINIPILIYQTFSIDAGKTLIEVHITPQSRLIEAY